MAKWGMDVKAAPGLRGTPPDAAVFGTKARCGQGICTESYGMAIKWRGRPLPRWGYHSGECRGEAGGESGHGSNHAGERLACCILFGAVLVKTNVLLVLPNKLAELGAVYDCLH